MGLYWCNMDLWKLLDQIVDQDSQDGWRANISPYLFQYAFYLSFVGDSQVNSDRN